MLFSFVQLYNEDLIDLFDCNRDAVSWLWAGINVHVTV